MMKVRGKKSSAGIWTAGIVLMGALFGWIAWADEIAQDVTNNAQAASTASKVAVDPSAVTMVQQARETIESTQNNMISGDLYGGAIPGLPNAPAMQPPDLVIYNHLNGYCSGSNEGANCPSDPLLINGDIKVSTLLSGTVYDSARQGAVQLFLNNLMDPSGTSPIANFQKNIPISAAISDPTVKASYAQALTDEALISVARQAFAEIIAKRTPPATGSPSEMQMMEQTAMQRGMSSAWAASLATLTPQQIQIEQAKMQAFELWMQYQQYRQTEVVQALLAASIVQSFQRSKAVASTFSQMQNSGSTSAPAASTGSN